MKQLIENSFPLFVIGFMFITFGYVFFYHIPTTVKNEYINKCLDKSGVPVTLMTHVKGYEDGWNCVEPSKKVNTGEK